MAALQFNKASKKSAKLRMALIGAAGAGKTYSALSIASNLEGPVAVIDTERGSASKYSDVFSFDVLELELHSPQNYIEAIEAAEEAGYKTLIIDSLSHAWTGKGGALEQVDRVARRQQSNNTFGAWRDVTPLHNQMVEAIIMARMNIIVTMRAKTEYVQEKNEKTGKTTVRKIGMAPVQRDGLEYEFDVVADLDQDNNCIIGKTRCSSIAGGVFPKAGRDLARKLSAWLSDGEAVDTVRAETPKLQTKVEAPKLEAVPHEARLKTPRVEVPAAERLDDEFEAEFEAEFDSDIVLCDCGIEAKYVRGKSGAGWVCGQLGGEEPCHFRKRDTQFGDASQNIAHAA